MNAEQLEEFKKLAEYCKKAGIESLKTGPNGEIDIKFIHQALLPKNAYQLKKEAEETKKSLEDISANAILEAERALLWSTQIDEGAH